jgi:Rod binding domain-containing protein
MSSSTPPITTAGIGTDAGYPNLNVADIPQNIRNGNGQAKQAYAQGLAFEGMLVNELSQQMASTMYGGQGSASGGDSSGSDGGSSSDGSSSGGLLSGAGAYASLIPQTLTSSIMDSGGLGMAEQFAQETDPSLADASSPNADASPTAVTNGQGAA